MRRALVALAAAALLAVPAAGARPTDTPGVTPTQIVLGATGPLTGSESQYAAGAERRAGVLRATSTTHGGVLRPQDRLQGRGRPVRPRADRRADAEARRAGQRLRDLQLDRHRACARGAPVPQPAARCRSSSSAPAPRRSRRSTSSTRGRWACCRATPARARSTAARSSRRQPKAKIGVLYENDEYGQELLAGLKRGLGSHANQIVGDASRTRCSTRASTRRSQRSRHRAPTRSSSSRCRSRRSRRS